MASQLFITRMRLTWNWHLASGHCSPGLSTDWLFKTEVVAALVDLTCGQGLPARTACGTFVCRDLATLSCAYFPLSAAQ